MLAEFKKDCFAELIATQKNKSDSFEGRTPNAKYAKKNVKSASSDHSLSTPKKKDILLGDLIEEYVSRDARKARQILLERGFKYVRSDVWRGKLLDAMTVSFTCVRNAVRLNFFML